MIKVLRRLFGGCVQRTHSAAQLGISAAGGRIHRESNPTTHSQIPHNR